MNIYKLLNLCFAIETISSHAFLIKRATVVIIKLQSCFYKTKKRKLRNSNAETLRLLNSLNTATFYVRFRSCFLLLARFFVVFSVFLIYFLFFKVLDSFPYRFLDISFKKSSEFNDVARKVERPNQHIMADDFRTLNYK